MWCFYIRKCSKFFEQYNFERTHCDMYFEHCFRGKGGSSCFKYRDWQCQGSGVGAGTHATPLNFFA